MEHFFLMPMTQNGVRMKTTINTTPMSHGLKVNRDQKS